VTVTVCPATVTVPLRSLPVLGPKPIATVPLPDPDAPERIAIHEAFEEAVQEHPDVVVTNTVAPPAPEPADIEVGLTE
jgi:hypothetical protein